MLSKITLSQSYVDNIFSDSSFLRRIVFTNECVFHVSEFAATQNTRT